ncbi:hypothetical protein EKO27_g8516 [Xylaria grammica]|uniref:Uncharacterized protein n=1 Tax=Xylaria grammica TaxID=363999 RepID=A0A439CWJ5_9PEZI|nr:hypothetical protein EKO27_g8516 [Xylaria grammica]
MASGNDSSPPDAEPKGVQQLLKSLNNLENPEVSVADKQEDSPNPVDNSHPAEDHEQEGEIDKSSWKAWWKSQLITIVVIVALVIFAIYYGTIYYRLASFLVNYQKGHDEASLTQNTQTQAIPATTIVKVAPVHHIVEGGSSQIRSVCSLSTPALPENSYIPPSAYTVTTTSSTTYFITTKIGETVQSIGPQGIRPGFGFASIPTLKEFTLSAAVVVACVAAWRYL